MNHHHTSLWQGTFLGFLSIFHLGILLLAFFEILVFLQKMSENFENVTFWMIISLLTILLSTIVFNIFRGKKWALITYMVITVILLINAIYNFLNGGIFGTFINAAILVLQIYCLKQPYFSRS